MATSPLASWGPHGGEKLIWLHSLGKPKAHPLTHPTGRIHAKKQGKESKIAQKVAVRAPCALTLPLGANMSANMLHHPCHLGGPHVGKVAT